ncbi:MAG: hypothetical protein K0S08_1624 [Gammaproteobacteria bacterium]|jgi:hypothetical protein|nr:hypothetical protein [Gammaproteobacteria bacterium]
MCKLKLALLTSSLVLACSGYACTVEILQNNKVIGRFLDSYRPYHGFINLPQNTPLTVQFTNCQCPPLLTSNSPSSTPFSGTTAAKTQSPNHQERSAYIDEQGR